MKLELFFIAITCFVIYNMYYDNKLTKKLLSYKKYYQIGMILFAALCLYLMLKRNPSQSKNMLLYTNNLIKHMPIDRSTIDMISPIFDFTNTLQNNNGLNNNINDTNSFMSQLNRQINPEYNPQFISKQQRYMLQQSQQQNGGMNHMKATKRSVSETKKKYVAAMQEWKCAQCNRRLTHTFEIDHKIRLELGGSNDATYLVAMCRECHGQKTAFENM